MYCLSAWVLLRRKRAGEPDRMPSGDLFRRLKQGITVPSLQRRLLLPQLDNHGAVQPWRLLPGGHVERQTVQRRLLLPRGLQEHDAVPCWLCVRVGWPVQCVGMRCGELLSCGVVERCGLRAGQILPPRLVQRDRLRGWLLLPQYVGSASLQGRL